MQYRTLGSILIALLTFGFLAACGEEEQQDLQCQVETVDDTTFIDCPDGSTAEVPHADDGEDGEDGASCSVSDNEDGTSTISCEDGTEVIVEDGQDGQDGEDGEDGADGEDGSSCSVEDNGNGTYELTCDDGTSVTISDGQDGQDGEDGEDGEDGADGADGEDGEDGSSCTISDLGPGFYELTCDDGTAVTFSDGQDGDDGSSCTIVNNMDGTATLECPDGTSASFNIDGTDLTASEVDITVDGDTIDWSVTVLNQGPEDTDVSFNVDMFLDQDDAPEFGDSGDYSGTIDGIDGWEEKTVSGSIDGAEDGPYSSWVVIDTDEAVDESNIDNNIVGPYEFAVGDYSDLEITDFQLEIDDEEEILIWTLTFRNNGPADAGFIEYATFFHEEEAPEHESSGYTGLFWDEVSSLDAGEEVTVTLESSDYPNDGDPGNYSSWALVDLFEFIDDPFRHKAVAGPINYTISN